MLSNYDVLKIFSFPKDQALRLKWMEACGFSESDIYPKRKLCSVHFEKNCYTGLNKNVLKRGSIPTLHIKKLVKLLGIVCINILCIK